MIPNAEFLETLFYKEFLVHIDTSSACIGVVFDGQLPNTLMSAATIYGGKDDEPFDGNSRKIHAMLIRHLSKALGTNVQAARCRTQAGLHPRSAG